MVNSHEVIPSLAEVRLPTKSTEIKFFFQIQMKKIVFISSIEACLCPKAVSTCLLEYHHILVLSDMILHTHQGLTVNLVNKFE